MDQVVDHQDDMKRMVLQSRHHTAALGEMDNGKGSASMKNMVNSVAVDKKDRKVVAHNMWKRKHQVVEGWDYCMKVDMNVSETADTEADSMRETVDPDKETAEGKVEGKAWVA